jgi:hypothetical protein
MNEIRLPKHVIHLLENRWANRLQQDLKEWSGNRMRSVLFGHTQNHNARAIPSSSIVVVHQTRPPLL